MKKRKDILRSDSRGVIPTAKGYCLLDAGFFYQMKTSITTKSEPHNFGFTKKDITRFQRAAASVGMTIEDWAKQALRGAAECDLEPVPAASNTGGESETISVTFPKKDAARCRRAAAFCKLSFDEWLKGSIIVSMECDEDDMATGWGKNAGREFEVGRDLHGWQWREALGDPVAQGF
jgi:hypothetical protein